MDQLNKLRLLAGIPIRQPAPKPLREARAVPKTRMELTPKTEEAMKARVLAITAAAKHVKSAITALENIPAVDFMGDVPHLIEELEYVLNGDHGEGGLASLATMYQSDYRSWKRSTNKAAKAAQASAPVAEAVDREMLGDEDPTRDFDEFDPEKPEIEYNDVEGEDPDAPADGEEFDFDAEGGEDEVPEDPAAFADASADADAAAFGQKGGDEKVDAAIAALKAGFTGSDEASADEFDFDAAGEDLEAVPGEEGSDMPAGDGEDEFADDEFDGPGEPLPGEDPGAVGEEEPGYGEDDGELDQFGEAVTPYREYKVGRMPTVNGTPDYPGQQVGAQRGVTHPKAVAVRKEVADRIKATRAMPGGREELARARDKRRYMQKPTSTGISYESVEDKTFFNNSEETTAVPGDKDKKVKVPPSIKTQLQDLISKVENDMKYLKVNDRDARWFSEALVAAYQQLLTHLNDGSMYDIKKAQIYMTSLMGPILHTLPPEVVKFIARGGEPSSVSDFMKPVEPKYPVTGKAFKPEGE